VKWRFSVSFEACVGVALIRGFPKLQTVTAFMEQTHNASGSLHATAIKKVAFRSEIGLELKIAISSESNIFDIAIWAKPLSSRYDLNSIANVPKLQAPVKLLGIMIRRRMLRLPGSIGIANPLSIGQDVVGAVLPGLELLSVNVGHQNPVSVQLSTLCGTRCAEHGFQS
jgi:hypothetical protein